jgi:small subunit ribosomal protein S4e
LLARFVSDVITIPATQEFFRLLYDTKGRFTVHRIKAQEADVCVESLYCFLLLRPFVARPHAPPNLTVCSCSVLFVQYKLCKVKRVDIGAKGIPRLVTHDGRTIRYPNPDIKVNDTVKVDLATGKITDSIKFDVGNLCMITGGHNLGRIGVIERREKHHGSYEIVHVKDAVGQKFATRLNNVFVIGKGYTSLVSIPSHKGVKRSIIEEKVKGNTADNE